MGIRAAVKSGTHLEKLIIYFNLNSKFILKTKGYVTYMYMHVCDMFAGDEDRSVTMVCIIISFTVCGGGGVSKCSVGHICNIG